MPEQITISVDADIVRILRTEAWRGNAQRILELADAIEAALPRAPEPPAKGSIWEAANGEIYVRVSGLAFPWKLVRSPREYYTSWEALYSQGGWLIFDGSTLNSAPRWLRKDAESLDAKPERNTAIREECACCPGPPTE